MTDILLGAADLYNWSQIAPWAMSARASGFTGDIFLVTYRLNENIEKQAEALNINLYPVEHDAYMKLIQHGIPGSPTQAHNLRFYHFWELMTRLQMWNYEYAIITDVRDVIFQTNPSVAVRKFISTKELIAPSEGITFENEEWNAHNMKSGFGPNLWDLGISRTSTVYNVGTIAGGATLMKDLCQTIFITTEGRYYPSDQSSFNLLVTGVLSSITNKLSMMNGWAAQCGTTLDPTKSWLWDRLNEPRPIIKDGIVYAYNDIPHCIVHQYDRVPELKAFIQGKYV